MADVVILDTADINSNVRGNQAGPVWVNTSVGYFFMFRATTTSLVVYKTTNGGSSWAFLATVKTANVGDYSVWFDKWTPGDSGEIIHIGYVEVPGTTSMNVHYNSLDTSDDSLSGEVTIEAFTGLVGAAFWTNIRTATADNGSVSITKAQGGNLYVAASMHVEDVGGDSDLFVFERSVDDGATWVARTNPYEAAPNDNILLAPANTSDLQDIAGFYFDGSQSATSLKMYDDSANTWTETGSVSTGSLQDDTWNESVAVRHSDKHVIAAFLTGGDAVSTDLLVYDLTVDSIAAPTLTLKTNVWTDQAERQDCSVFIDQITDDIYVAWLQGGVWTATAEAFYAKSGDGGTTWGTPVNYDEDAADDHRHICAGHSTPGAAAGRFYLCWFNSDFGDWIGGFTNSLELALDIVLSPTSVSITIAIPAPSISLPPTIISVTPSSFADAETGITIAGFNFGAGP